MNLSTSLIAALVSSIVMVSSALAEDFRVDVSHSQVVFKVKHLGISTVTGYFNDFNASFDIESGDLSTLSARATIQTASVDTRDDDRDNHLKSSDFFDAESHPTIQFTSTKAEVVDTSRVKLHGNLTIRGVTRPVVLDTEFQGAATGPMGKQRAAFTASTTINRKDFGVSWNKTLDAGGLVVGEEVRIQIELEAVSMETTD